MGSASAHENETKKIMPIDHIVGGAFGWRLPEANKTFYEDWAKPRVFGVGDTLGKCFDSFLLISSFNNTDVHAGCI